MRLKKVIQDRAKENLRLATGGDRKSEQYKKQGSQKSDEVQKPVRTDEELAKLAGGDKRSENSKTLLQKSAKAKKVNTVEELAKLAGVSRDTF